MGNKTDSFIVKLIVFLVLIGSMYLLGAYINGTFNPLRFGVISKIIFGAWSIVWFFIILFTRV
jgi:hypothetical protein